MKEHRTIACIGQERKFARLRITVRRRLIADIQQRKANDIIRPNPVNRAVVANGRFAP